jgi:hypothetical protein
MQAQAVFFSFFTVFAQAKGDEMKSQSGQQIRTVGFFLSFFFSFYPKQIKSR